MNIVICNGRLTGRLALTLALLVSNSTQIVLLGESNRAAVALAAQKPSTSNSNDRRAQKKQQNDDTIATRPRRAAAETEAVQNASPSGPIIRIALMTDVSSIALSSPTGLTVRGDSTTDVEGKNIPNGSLLVELRQQPEPADPLPPMSSRKPSSSHSR